MFSEDSAARKSLCDDQERLYRSQGFSPAEEQMLKIISPNKKFSIIDDYHILTFNLRFLTQSHLQGSWIDQFINTLFQQEESEEEKDQTQEKQQKITEEKRSKKSIPQLRAKFHKWIPMFSVMQWLKKELSQHLQEGYLSEHSLWISVIDFSQNHVYINLGSNLSEIVKKPYFKGHIQVLTYQAF